MNPLSLRAQFLRNCLEQIDCPYIWGAKGVVLRGKLAFDCSGLVTWSLLEIGGPDWRQTHNTDKLWDECHAVTVPRPGSLCLYGANGDPSHVMVYVADGLCVGASGGGRLTKTEAIAAQQGARVKVPRKGVDYRPDFLGYREIPFIFNKEPHV